MSANLGGHRARAIPTSGTKARKKDCNPLIYKASYIAYFADSLQIAQRATYDIISGCSLTKPRRRSLLRPAGRASVIVAISYRLKPEFNNANRSARSSG